MTSGRRATPARGGRVAARLAAAGVPQTLVVRDPARAPHHAGAAVVRAGFGDRRALAEALTGADRVLMVSASESEDRLDQHRSFVDAAVAAGAGHIVYTSFLGAAPDATFTLARDHWVTERYIRDSGLAYTFLRDGLYADFMPGLVGEDGVISGPAGEGAASVVAQDDIADAAVAVLLDAPAHDGAVYDLTGPRALTLAEIAAELSEVTGRRVTYRPETPTEAYRSRESSGAPRWQLDAWVSTYTAIAAGELAGVSDAVPRLTGHPATPLAEVLRRAAA
ncbi:SDR family oxidoreductase [Streptomyces sp. ventii]|uniref:SDR family oxidoreductase n=1 Tax=Streptomyces spiramenti TaxID=2720606 RepID=A0ABX1ARY9_9ACTN|nr:SDR family oxidoreductase [Streptomyces spiramenti]